MSNPLRSGICRRNMLHLISTSSGTPFGKNSFTFRFFGLRMQVSLGVLMVYCDEKQNSNIPSQKRQGAGWNGTVVNHKVRTFEELRV